MVAPQRQQIGFGLAKPEEGHLGLVEHNGETWIAYGRRPLLAVRHVALVGRHNLSNALAALALGVAMRWNLAAMVRVLPTFRGLPHRCQWVGLYRKVNWYNDSKGTNVGSTIAALMGVPGERVSIILGGIGKGQDFSLLRPALEQRARAIVAIGEAAPIIYAAVNGTAPLCYAESMTAAVSSAFAFTYPGDSVLLSPACASFDMFENYKDRGNKFVAAVEAFGNQ
jgi:UDP-N-acetylmuramoylalanine--D-glutamate ligase